jgi:hypothetical protein
MAHPTRQTAVRRLLRPLLALLLAGLALPYAARAAELVMFVEAGCPWCQRWEREVGGAYPRSPEGQVAPLRRIDISEARRSGIRLAAPVNVTPTFVLVDDGIERGRITGYPGAEFFWGMLEQLMRRLVPAAPPSGRDAANDRQGGTDRAGSGAFRSADASAG